MKKLILLLAQLFCRHKYQYTEINHDGINTMECKWCGKKKVVKILSLLALAFMMCGCKQSTNNIEASVGGSTLTTAFQTIMIDSCEYIVGAPKMAHKGNCKYCAERRKKEREELIRKIKEQ